MNQQPLFFRNAYVPVLTSHNLSPIYALAGKIVYCTTSFVREEEVASEIANSLKDFDASQDLIVPVGNVTNNLILGAAAAIRAIKVQPSSDDGKSSTTHTQFFVAVYRDGEYHIQSVAIGGNNEQSR